MCQIMNKSIFEYCSSSDGSGGESADEGITFNNQTPSTQQPLAM